MTIRVEYGALESANTQMQQISRTLDENLNALRSRLMRMQWEGDDQVAYRAHQAQWDQAVDGLNAVLNEVGIKVGEARATYGANEARGVQRWGG
jgi:WXG100 family type VII secretion target